MAVMSSSRGQTVKPDPGSVAHALSSRIVRRVFFYSDYSEAGPNFDSPVQ